MLNSIAILGRPNVGKSSLFNKLTKSRNAIVSDFSGLTKDRNFGYTTIKDQKYLIIDTGGVGSEVTEFSAAITEQALIAAEDSKLILLLIDSSEELTADDIDLFQTIRKMNKNFRVVLNKIDIKKRSNAKEDLLQRGSGEILEISAEHSRGIKELQSFIAENFNEDVNFEIERSELFRFNPRSVNVSFTVAEFVTAERTINLDRINFPEENRASLTDSTCQVQFLVRKDTEELIVADSFHIIADYALINQVDSTLLLSIEKVPLNIIDSRISNPQVRVIYNE